MRPVENFSSLFHKGLVRLEGIYVNTREANRGNAFSPEACLEQAGSKQRETDL